MLLDEEDASGSTGVVAVYDGRRHVLTVAGVGDSMCVLSRSGKAVMLNRMHRLDNVDEVERIKRAGGTIINKRLVYFYETYVFWSLTMPIHDCAELMACWRYQGRLETHSSNPSVTTTTPRAPPTAWSSPRPRCVPR